EAVGPVEAVVPAGRAGPLEGGATAGSAGVAAGAVGAASVAASVSASVACRSSFHIQPSARPTTASPIADGPPMTRTPLRRDERMLGDSSASPPSEETAAVEGRDTAGGVTRMVCDEGVLVGVTDGEGKPPGPACIEGRGTMYPVGAREERAPRTCESAPRI